jgi:hypothetical protein
MGARDARRITFWTFRIIIKLCRSYVVLKLDANLSYAPTFLLHADPAMQTILHEACNEA